MPIMSQALYWSSNDEKMTDFVPEYRAFRLIEKLMGAHTQPVYHTDVFNNKNLLKWASWFSET